MSETDGIPQLDITYSGVPNGLYNEAVSAKKRIQNLKTLPHSKPRLSPAKLPPDTSQVEFDTAIIALKQLLREKYVEVNDKPLIDGWYMVSLICCAFVPNDANNGDFQEYP